jgi:hypothetical protein
MLTFKELATRKDVIFWSCVILAGVFDSAHDGFGMLVFLILAVGVAIIN